MGGGREAPCIFPPPPKKVEELAEISAGCTGNISERWTVKERVNGKPENMPDNKRCL